MRMRAVAAVTGVCWAAALYVAPAASGTGSGPAGLETAPQEIVLNGEDNRLNAYDAETGAKHTVIPSAVDDPDEGLDINAEICVVPDGVPWKPTGEIWFIAGEDTEQNTQEGVIKQGWGLFRLTGDRLEDLGAVELGKLVPDSFVTDADNPENFGCAVLPDGRVVTGDVGDQLPQDPATGQVIVWFPTSAHVQGATGPARNDFARVPHCKIDVALGTAGGMEVDDEYVYIASNRPNLATLEPGGIYRYDYSLWPTGESPADGCGRTDQSGEQLADEDKVGKELFIPQVPGLLTTPSDIVHSGNGTFYISSVFTGQVAEYGADGIFRRWVVFTTGQIGGITPFGIDVDSKGRLWVADIGVLGDGPAEDAGSVVRYTLGAVAPTETTVVDDGLQFPDGLGILTLPAAASGPGRAADDGEAGRPLGPATLPATGGSVPMLVGAFALAAGLSWRAGWRHLARERAARRL